MCCKSCLLSLSLFLAVLLSPVLIQAQTATKTVASTSVKAEPVAPNQAFTEGAVQKTKTNKCVTVLPNAVRPLLLAHLIAQQYVHQIARLVNANRVHVKWAAGPKYKQSQVLCGYVSCR